MENVIQFPEGGKDGPRLDIDAMDMRFDLFKENLITFYGDCGSEDPELDAAATMEVFLTGGVETSPAIRRAAWVSGLQGDFTHADIDRVAFLNWITHGTISVSA